ncbi:MAG: DNA-binding response regulator [Motiliproteus sp.]|nr:DNA-binding response regulator [Motiliproteus sp.]MCW9052506.1 DNA-binding response regulator [Motiliproteus sp.]
MLFLTLVVVASGGDLMVDLSQGASRSHLIQETMLLSLALFILGWLVFDNHRKKQQILDLHDELEAAKELPQPESQQVMEARQQLGEAIREQFNQWKLTQSEQEVGMMLLKGFSLKEIAVLRGTADKTIRQQASSIYQKSGVQGRHAFSAWFIEDLL